MESTFDLDSMNFGVDSNRNVEMENSQSLKNSSMAERLVFSLRNIDLKRRCLCDTCKE